MPSVSCVCQRFPSLAWGFTFSKFSNLERNFINWSWSKHKLICKEWIHLDENEFVIIQFVSVFITLHLVLFFYSCIVLKEITLLYSKCAMKLWQGLYSCSYNLGPMGLILNPYSCCTVCQENNNFSLYQFFEGQLHGAKKTTSVCCYCLLLLVMLQVPTCTSEEVA